MRQLDEVRGMMPPDGKSTFGECVTEMAKHKGYRTQVSLRRILASHGYMIKDRTLANYLYGRSVVDPALPHYLRKALNLNKKESRELADAYTYGQPFRGQRGEKIGA